MVTSPSSPAVAVENAIETPFVLAIHVRDEVPVSVFAARDLTSAMRPDGDADFAELGDGPVMRRVSDFLARRRRGIDGDFALEPGPPHALLQDELGHGGTADVPMADEEKGFRIRRV